MIRPGVRRFFRLGRGDARAELDEEIGLHVEQRTEQLIRRGIPPDSARAEALRRFAATDAARAELYRAAAERDRTVHLREWLQSWRQDALLTARSFLRYSGFSAAVVLTLTLAIGATVTIVSIVDGVLLRPLPYEEPARLYSLVDRMKTSGEESPPSPLELHELRQRLTTFSELAGVWQTMVSLTGGGSPELLPMQRVSANFFTLLGVRPLLGQTFRPEDDVPGSEPVVVLSHGLWQRRFGGAASIIGQTIDLDGDSRLVLGVMPDGFAFGNFRSDLWLPLPFPDHPGRFLNVIGRLKPGVPAGIAATDQRRAMEELAVENPKYYGQLTSSLIPLRTRIVGDARAVLIALFGAVALLLLIACANIANLLLARALRRSREMAVRLSLGAGRARLIRQLLTESALLAAAGGVAGVLLAYGAVRYIMTRPVAATALPRAAEVTIDMRIIALAVLVTGITALLFGLAPALIGSRAEAFGTLLRGGRGNTGGPRLGRTRSMLVIAQVALVAVLLVGAGLLGRSLWLLQHVDLGFDTAQVVAATVARSDRSYAGAETESPRRYFTGLLDEVAALPGVTTAGMIQHVPLTGERSTTGISMDGTDQFTGGADIRVVGGDYFSATGTRLLAGRTFTPADDERAPVVYVINEALAGVVAPGENAVGRRLSYGWGAVEDGKLVPVVITGEIVGVVENVRESGPALDAGPALYRPFAQDPWPTMSIIVRTEGDADAMGKAITARIHQRNPNQTVTVRTMAEIAATLLARPRLQLFIVGLFAALALILAAIGLYGVIAFAVDQRGQEIGVRLALGATPAMVTRMVVQQGLALTTVGLLGGVVAALLALPALKSLVFGVQLTDPATLLAASAFILIIATLSTLGPALRAARTDPNVVLRSE